MSELHQPNILVVDDNPATLYTTSRVLAAAGFGVRQATTGHGALDAARSEVALIVLDVNLPDISGFEVCRRLRADTSTSHLPIVHLSATFVKDVDKVQGFEIGADGYLTHPVEPPVLIATVQAFLRTRQAEEDTRRSEAKFRAVFDKAPCGIALLDRDLVCVEANPTMAVMFRRTAEQLVGASLAPFLASTEGIAPIHDAVAQHGAWRGASAMTLEPDDVRHFDWTITRHALPDVHLVVVNDVTALVKLEHERKLLLESERAARAEAERANRVKDEFLATLAHDLRSPLGAIVNWCRVLRQPGLRSAETAEGLRAIERNATVQVQLIADLLDVSRIAAGKLRLRIEEVDAEALVDGALDVVRTSATAKQITLHKSVALRARWIAADSARMQQVVWNLLSNAVKFTPPEGRIDVMLQSDDSSLEIVVRDNGQGMSADLLPRIFHRFSQGAQHGQQDGLGLGLSIVQHVVEAHDGTVAAASDGPGRGAEFRVRLPAHVHRTGAIASDGPAPHHRFDGIRVLVIDDDPEMRDLLLRVLQEHGAQVATANGPATALELLTPFAPHALISDIGMPERDGYQLIREVRAAGFTNDVLPAIAVTAFSGDVERRRSLEAGFDRHFTKPFTPSEVVAAMAQLLASRSASTRR